MQYYSCSIYIYIYIAIHEKNIISSDFHLFRSLYYLIHVYKSINLSRHFQTSSSILKYML